MGGGGGGGGGGEGAGGGGGGGGGGRGGALPVYERMGFKVCLLQTNVIIYIFTYLNSLDV